MAPRHGRIVTNRVAENWSMAIARPSGARVNPRMGEADRRDAMPKALDERLLFAVPYAEPTAREVIPREIGQGLLERPSERGAGSGCDRVSQRSSCLVTGSNVSNG